MSASFHPGAYKIVSLISPERKRPTGINFTVPSFQNVCLDLPVQDWHVEKVAAFAVRFSLDGYNYTGVKDDKLIVSIRREDEVDWLVRRYEDKGAYTIRLKDDPSKGWMVAPELSPNPEIMMAKIDPDAPTNEQLFRFVPANSED